MRLDYFIHTCTMMMMMTMMMMTTTTMMMITMMIMMIMGVNLVKLVQGQAVAQLIRTVSPLFVLSSTPTIAIYYQQAQR